MGIRALVVFIVIAMALVVGVLASTFEVGARLAGWLVIGLVPVMWMVLYLSERVIGRDIWHFTAPYPYRWMEEVATVTEAFRRQTAPERELTDVEPEEIRLVA